MMAPNWLNLLLIWMASLHVLVLATQTLNTAGTLEVLIADDFASGSYNYDVFLHEDVTNKRFQLNPYSFGPDLTTLRTSMWAKVWIRNAPPEPQDQDAHLVHSNRDNDVQRLNIYDVLRYELVRENHCSCLFLLSVIFRP